MTRLIFCLLLSYAAIADVNVGNGGDVTKINGKYFLLDLVEAGVHQHPYTNPTTSIVTEYKNSVLSFDLPISTPKNLLISKLSEIRAVNKGFAEVLLSAMGLYDWRLVTYNLSNIDDEGAIYKGHLEQIAIRAGTTIYINENLWGELDDANKSALIFHELIYGILKPEKLNGYDEQWSYRAREINGFIHTNKWDSGRKNFSRKFANFVPSAKWQLVRAKNGNIQTLAGVYLDGVLIATPRFTNIRRIEAQCSRVSNGSLKGRYKLHSAVKEIEVKFSTAIGRNGVFEFISWGNNLDRAPDDMSLREKVYDRTPTVLEPYVLIDWSTINYKTRKDCIDSANIFLKKNKPFFDKFK